jgi:hypothetical protein
MRQGEKDCNFLLSNSLAQRVNFTTSLAYLGSFAQILHDHSSSSKFLVIPGLRSGLD